MDEQQRLQEEQYAFPYHYIPRLGDEGFSPVRYWAWSHHYLGGFEVVFDALESIDFDSLLDVGCGDGRFIAEMVKRRPNAELLGVDYSRHAIALARALNPGVAFQALDIVRGGLDRQFSVATMIEVLEHIPPTDVDGFLEAVAASITPGGTLVLTVPHRNKSLQPKHYQHFCSACLRDVLAPHFESVTFVPFDRRSHGIRWLHRALGGKGEHFLVTNRRVLAAFWKVYRERFLYTEEDRCLRIAAVCSGRKA